MKQLNLLIGDNFKVGEVIITLESVHDTRSKPDVLGMTNNLEANFKIQHTILKMGDTMCHLETRRDKGHGENYCQIDSTHRMSIVNFNGKVLTIRVDETNNPINHSASAVPCPTCMAGLSRSPQKEKFSTRSDMSSYIVPIVVILIIILIVYFMMNKKI
jgi:hypothetical protein